MDDDSKLGNFAQDIKEKWNKDRQPDFKSSVTGKEKQKPKSKQKVEARGAEDELRGAESAAASGGYYNNGASVQGGEENPSGFSYVGSGKKQNKKSKGKSKVAKASAVIVVLVIMLFVMAISALGNPIFQVGNWDFNMMDSIGFSGRIGILEKTATFVVGADLEEGEVSDKLAGNLAKQGIVVGQVTEAGDFVRTNTYVANVEDLKDLAVLGNYQANPSEGELAVLFKDGVVEAKDFVAALESNPEMYMAFLDAADIGAAYWYSEEMEEQLDQLGVRNLRSAFADWQSTGDSEKDTENYEKQKKELLDGDSDLTVSGVSNVVSENGTVSGVDGITEQVSGSDSSVAVISGVTDKMEDSTQSGANAKATQSLNAVISANKSYRAGKCFMFSESIMQRARIDGTGPINEFMSDAYKDRSVSYTDALTTESVETDGSILSSRTMQATIGGGGFSDSEAASFSRDNGVVTMNSKGASVGDGVIRGTVISTDGEKKSDILMGILPGVKADASELEILSDGVDKAIIQSNAEQFTGVEGGNLIPGGGEFILNTVDSHLIAALPSDEQTVMAYHREAGEMIARRAEAERATKSPFDVSSPYTFMGSLTRNLATTIMKSRANSGSGSSMVGMVASMTGDSVKGLYNTVVADGDDGSYEMATGDYCETAAVVGASSSVLCGAKYTLTTKHMDMTDEELEDVLKSKGALDGDGEIEPKGGLSLYVAAGMGRQSTVGIQDAEVCKRYKELEDDIWRDFLDGLAGLFGQYRACDGREDVGTGEKYTLNSSNSERDNLEYYAAYVMRDEVKSLLDGGTGKVAKYKEKYYAEHPLDNSREGILARRSGLTKQEVQVALQYADYLAFIAKYDASTRYAFGGLKVAKPVEPLVDHANQVAVELYVMWQGRTEYDDLRGRIRVV